MAEAFAVCICILLLPILALYVTIRELWSLFKWLEQQFGLRALGLGFLFIALVGLYGLQKECGDYRCLHSTGTTGTQKPDLSYCEITP